MDVNILGSGSPLPSSHGGQSILITVGGESLLFDCGPMTVERLLEQRVPLSDINDVFITHQHLDHNSSFFHFAITSWMYGRQELNVYGPKGTDSLLEALENIYDQDIAYRKDFGRPIEGITDIGYREVTDDFSVSGDGWMVTAQRVDHSILTYAFRVDDERNDRSIVYSADTTKLDSMVEFAAGADVLIHNAAVGKVREMSESDPVMDRESWKQYLSNNPVPEETPMVQSHTSPAEAGEIAAVADVDTLVLTHFLPSQDLEAAKADAAANFDGPVHLASDPLSLDV